MASYVCPASSNQAQAPPKTRLSGRGRKVCQFIDKRIAGPRRMPCPDRLESLEAGRHLCASERWCGWLVINKRPRQARHS
ncbi:hypothetical protein ACQKWADRAFT_296400 [Trichoderma austrokoningii]